MPPLELAWSHARRFAFRFAFVFLVGAIVPWPAGWLEGTGALSEFAARPVEPVVLFLGRALGLGTLSADPGSDRLYDFVLFGLRLALALAAALAWSLLDRARPRYDRLHDALRVYVRYFLSSAMLVYGFAKVGLTQFTPLSVARLEQTFGDASPMGLLWRFMSYSPAYQIFGGVIEVAGGLLLLSRRTTTLGALVLSGMLANVFLLNLSYDVNVKIYSFQLLLMALFLALPDARRLWDLLVLHRPVDAAPAAPPRFASRRSNLAALALKALVVALFVGTSLWNELQARGRLEEALPRSPLAGRWAIEPGESFLFISNYRASVIAVARQRDGTARTYLLALDQENGNLTLTNRDDHSQAVLRVAQPAADRFTLDGELAKAPVHWTLRRLTPRPYPLLERGFHLISEGAPPNR